MRKIALAFGLLLLLLNCEQAPSTSTNLIHLIPQKSAAIVRIPDWEDFEASLQVNAPINLLKETQLNQRLSAYAALFQHFEPQDDTYLSFVALGDDDFDLALITKNHPKLISKDSSFSQQVQTYDYEGTTINSVAINDDYLHFFKKDAFFIASTSKLVLENAILQNNTGRDPIDASLEQMIKTSNSSSPNLYIKGSYYKRILKHTIPQLKFQSSQTPFNWLALDIDLDNKDALNFSGVLTSSQDGNQTLDLLNGFKPASSKLLAVAPAQSRAVVSFNFSDWETYKENLAAKRNASAKEFTVADEAFFKSIDEVAVVYTQTNQLLLAHSGNVSASELALAPISTEIERFRDLPIYQVSDSTFLEGAYKELLNPGIKHYYGFVENHLVFTNTLTNLKDFIANYQNDVTLKNTVGFSELSKKMSDASTLSYYGNTEILSGYISEKLSKKQGKILNQIDFTDYPAVMLQLVQADDFTYVNALTHKISAKTEASQIVQVASVTLDKDLLNAPQMLHNYRTKGQNILVQDISNTLYHINASGKIEWKKELDGPILGEIQQVDLYKNGRLQYAFTTPSHFYIIASDGTIVEPFDKDYSEITQPLAVFDYDGSRDYRFIITQGSALTMLDREGKKVKGFTYTQAPSTLKNVPQHIRFGTKDYIVIQLENGQLEILNRRGETRIKTTETFAFSDQPVFEKANNFLVFEKNGTLASISQSGKITRTQLQSGSDTQYDRLQKTEAILTPEQLSINNKKITIDLGIYKGLQVLKAKNTYYVTLTDLQNNKVYVYGSDGNLLPNFPVYGASELDFGSLNSATDLGFVTKGESDSIIIYQIN